MNRGIYVCDYCGSDNVTSDATAFWDVEKQVWTVDDVHDQDYCSNCGGEARLDWLEVDVLAEKDPVGTRKAVLVDEASENLQDNEYTDPDPCGVITSNKEKYYVLDIGTTSATEMVVLEKVSEWQWKIVEEADAVAA